MYFIKIIGIMINSVLFISHTLFYIAFLAFLQCSFSPGLLLRVCSFPSPSHKSTADKILVPHACRVITS